MRSGNQIGCLQKIEGDDEDKELIIPSNEDSSVSLMQDRDVLGPKNSGLLNLLSEAKKEEKTIHQALHLRYAENVESPNLQAHYPEYQERKSHESNSQESQSHKSKSQKHQLQDTESQKFLSQETKSQEAESQASFRFKYPDNETLTVPIKINPLSPDSTYPLSQWSEEIYNEIDKITSDPNTTKRSKINVSEDQNKENLNNESNADVEDASSNQIGNIPSNALQDHGNTLKLSNQDTDSYAFSQWSEDFYQQIERTDSKTWKSSTHESSIKESNKVTGRTCASGFKSDGKRNIFDEDFSDLNIDKSLKGFFRANAIIQTEKEMSSKSDGMNGNNLSKSISSIKPVAGFTTAGGKAVSVSTAALDHIRASQLPELKSNLTDCAESSNIFGEDLSDLNLDNIPKGKHGFSKASKSISTTKPVAGFTTAGGKTVSVSSAALDHIRASQLPKNEMFCDLGSTKAKKMNLANSKKDRKNVCVNSGVPNDISKKVVTKGFKEEDYAKQSSSNKRSKLQKFDEFMKTYSETANSMQSTGFNEDVSNLKRGNEVQGFSAAEKINVLLEDGNSYEFSQWPEELYHDIERTSSVGKPSKLRGCVSDNKVTQLDTSQKEVQCKKSDSGNVLDNRNNIFGEDLSDLNLDNIPIDKLGFSKASKNISTTKPSAGFTTAGGKTVSVSSAALNHIKASQLPELKSNLTDYAESSNIFGEDLSDLNLDSVPKNKFGYSKASKSISTTKPVAGFDTAGGKTVSVSSAALDHIRASQLPESKPLSTSQSDLEVERISSENKNSEESLNRSAMKQSSLFVGFLSGAGKKVSVSETALNHIKASQPNHTCAQLSEKAGNETSKLLRVTPSSKPPASVLSSEGQAAEQTPDSSSTSLQRKPKEVEGIIRSSKRNIENSVTPPPKISMISKRRRLSNSRFNSPVMDKNTTR